MNTTFFYKVFLIITIHRNNDLLFRWALGHYVDLRFGLVIAFDHSLNIIYILCFEGRKDFFDFKNTFSIAFCLRGLYV